MMGARKPAADLQLLAEQLKVVSDPTRLIVLDLLMQGVQCNCELSEELQLAPNLVSHHLSVLAQAGLVDTERDAYDGRWVYYSVSRNALEALTCAFVAFLDSARIRPRRANCGPRGLLVPDIDLSTSEA